MKLIKLQNVLHCNCLTSLLPDYQSTSIAAGLRLFIDDTGLPGSECDRNVISHQLYLKVRALIPIYNVFLILFFTPLSKNESRIFILSDRNLYCPKVPLCFFCKQAIYYTNLVITTSYKEKLIYIFGSHRTSHVIAHTGSKIY